MNCALKTLIDNREVIQDKIFSIEKIFSRGYTNKEPVHLLSIARIDLLDLRNAIRLIEKGAMCNE